MQCSRAHVHKTHTIAYRNSFINLHAPKHQYKPALRRFRRVVARASSDADDTPPPEWFRALVEQAQDDPELAQLLASANSDPSTVESKMRSEMDALHARITGKLGSGEDAPPQVFFRPFDPFDLWVWIELYTPPTSSELEMAQEVINSWFMLGRLGAYNSTNLQVLYSSSGVGSVGGVGPARGEEGFEYDVEEATAGGLASTMHDMSELETRGPWVRFWVDMGTSDELGLDVLVNALLTFSKEHVGVRQIVVGGVNDDWATPDGRYVPEVSIDPMRFTS